MRRKLLAAALLALLLPIVPGSVARAAGKRAVARMEGEMGKEHQYTGVVLAVDGSNLVVQRTQGKLVTEARFGVDAATRVTDGRLKVDQTAVRAGSKVRIHYRATTRGVNYARRIELLPAARARRRARVH